VDKAKASRGESTGQDAAPAATKTTAKKATAKKAAKKAS
jgi:hypothetical protein